ncbi:MULTISPECIES: NAD(P)/FAD-dependent oxidoreductase [unclassified Caulobacter]|uniref:NAD(P)/FAD-dependent oxidoreductase n=1 Tax=unclassified Caulobacter TaxID=2648921 RepID=UPI0006FCACDE|nr:MULTISPECIES: FAD-dependent oxidoreductase [unclassified Caulobacter]KQV55444.1 ferredoxin reductase [Caulobacter sp. Root342]KQV71647.1 ferredoxin reductase [Caulobacter sp. Root343]
MSANANQNACVVIVGAGHAGGSAAAFLRQYGHEGRIVLIGDEPLLPYQRPPLSKAWLKGEADADSLSLKPVEWYADNNVSLRLSGVAERINRSEKTVTLASGEAISYDFLILATGARARELPIPGSDLAGVLALRTAADAELLKHALGPDKRLAVIGGGYVGLEAAASARALGSYAMVVERESRVLARVACETLSIFFQDYHGRHGVTFALNAGVAGFDGVDGHVTGVRFTDGQVVACDVALVGVGAIPNDELAKDAGLATANGVVVDLEARTNDPSVFAIGDVTHRPLPLYDRQFRLESVPNALEQAKQAASAILGRPGPSPEVPWFWSDQYDLKLQIAGLPFEADRQVVRGDVAAARFAVFHLKGDLLQAVEAVNAPPEFMAGKQLIAKRTPVDVHKLADPAVSMKEVAA